MGEKWWLTSEQDSEGVLRDTFYGYMHEVLTERTLHIAPEIALEIPQEYSYMWKQGYSVD